MLRRIMSFRICGSCTESVKPKVGYEKLSGADAAGALRVDAVRAAYECGLEGAGGVMLEDGVTYGQILLPAVVPFVLRTVSVLLNPHK